MQTSNISENLHFHGPDPIRGQADRIAASRFLELTYGLCGDESPNRYAFCLRRDRPKRRWAGRTDVIQGE